MSALLTRAHEGDPSAREALFDAVQGELRGMAAHYLAGERPGHLLQPTALVNEAYLKMAPDDHVPWASRAHFFHAAARAMRQILVDHARAQGRQKRGGGRRRVQASVTSIASAEDPADFLAVDDALRRLEEVDSRAAAVVRLRIFAGLEMATVGLLLGLSTRTVEREWAYARTWLYGALR